MGTTYAKLLRDPRWKAYREEILELDGATCSKCGATDKRLHVHHREYISGRKPWEYPPGLLEALCAGCHAAEHGKIPPRTDWTFVCHEDLGEIAAECEYCSEPIRHVFTIYHESWGLLDVGTDCCDDLTGTPEASDRRKKLDRLRRFLKSKRWRRGSHSSSISLAGIRVYVLPFGSAFRLRMSGHGASVLGSRVYSSEELARIGAFDAIVGGAAAKCLEARGSQ